MSATAALGRPRGGPTTRPLVEILGARWQLGAAVLGTAWDGATAGFALADGTLAIVPASWDGGPVLRPRAEGGMEVVPARQSPPPAMRAGLHTRPAAAMVADGAGGWLSGGADGRLVRCDRQGAVTLLADLGAPISAVAASGTRRAAATGARLHLLDVSGLDLPAPITALAFDPTGRVLACAHDGGATLWDGATPRTLACDGTPIALAWHPDGRTVAAALQQNAWAAWRIADGAVGAREACPNPPGAVRFSADGQYLATSNTGAILCWRFDPDPEPVVCGIASRVPAGAVAWHPRLAVLAAGYANGAVTLCQPGSADVLFVREANGDAIDKLAWSEDGGALSLGSRAGEIGVVALPDQIFRGAVR